jgi:hypothetical protein
MSRPLFSTTDLHGCYDETLRAFNQAGLVVGDRWVAPDVDLVLLGDYIDRGPKSAQLIDMLIRWEAEAQALGSTFTKLMGNHEMMMLTAPRQVEMAQLWLQPHVGGVDTLESYGVKLSYHLRPFYEPRYTKAIMKRHKEFFLSLKSYHVQNDILFVHAGLPPGTTRAQMDIGVGHLWVPRNQWVHNIDYTRLIQDFGAHRIAFGHSILFEGPVEFYGIALSTDTGSYEPEGCVTVVHYPSSGGFVVAGTSR